MVQTVQQPIVDLQRWFDTDVGQYALKWQQLKVDALVADVFGYRAIQVGFPKVDLLTQNRMPFKAYVGLTEIGSTVQTSQQARVIAEPEYLPFDSDSIDLLVLPHALECSHDQHALLREAQRVLVPEGRIVMTGFNPLSLWGFRHHLPFAKPWLPIASEGDVTPQKLKDWLRLLSFEIDRGHFGCYVPALRSQKWLDRFTFMEHAGDRWWPIFGAVYVVSAVKKVASMHLITPSWKLEKKRRSSRQVAVATYQKSRNMANK
jgi:SAM-dependent methyltransferase